MVDKEGKADTSAENAENKSEESSSRPISRQSQASSVSRSRSLTEKVTKVSNASNREAKTKSITSETLREEASSPSADSKSWKGIEENGAAENGDTNGDATPTMNKLADAEKQDPQLSLQEISLGGDAASSDQSQSKAKDAEKTAEGGEPLQKPPSRGEGIASRLPTIGWGNFGGGGGGGGGARGATEPKLTPAQNARKISTGFSTWLTRKGSSQAESPATRETMSPSRRSTTASLASVGSNPELTLTKLEEETHRVDGAKQTESLRDRFKYLRMREEAGIVTEESIEAGVSANASAPGEAGSGGAIAGLIGRGTSVGLGIASPSSVVNEKDGGLAVASESADRPRSRSVSPGAISTASDPHLAPSTVAGVAAGPSAMTDPAAPVDWDLWQSVVYEGPSAVARTSSEELSRAIAGGIPSAIRGVVWQVLAQSKNEELENTYRKLISRGTDKDSEMMSAINSDSSPPSSLANGSARGKFERTTSTTSIHSDHSSTAKSISSAQDAANPEATPKLSGTSPAERQRKAKEERAAIQKIERVIRKDLGSRTSFSKYAAAAGLQEGLFGVCKAYALYDEGVGYAQGMNFLVMPLLFNMPEEEAFCLLVRLMEQYHLRDMFIQDMPGLHLHLYQFERLLEDFEPALYCHLHRRAVRPELYATQWFLTLFAYRFPLQLVLRIYDLILSEGLGGAILKFGVVLMQKNAEALLGMNDMASLTTFLKERIFDVYIDRAPSSTSILESGFFGSSGDKEVYRADILVQDACTIKIAPEVLTAYTSEWEEKQALEQEREGELDTLRTTNNTLQQRVRNLEQRIEKSDAEHVQMASELVRTKVENQELSDRVESLNGQVTELQHLVDKGTEDVEAKLREQMDSIMHRNSEVQNTNRGLEEQMADMEKELVQTKMQWAELHSEHENLRLKWNDLRKALDA